MYVSVNRQYVFFTIASAFYLGFSRESVQMRSFILKVSTGVILRCVAGNMFPANFGLRGMAYGKVPAVLTRSNYKFSEDQFSTRRGIHVLLYNFFSFEKSW